MQKVFLSKEKVKEDFFNQFKNNILSLILFPIFAITFLTVTVLCVIYFYNTVPIFYHILFLFIAFFVTIISVWILIEELKTFNNVKNDRFYITNDVLVSMEQKRGTRFNVTFKSQPYILNFSNYGSYRVVEGQHNTFSETYKMSDDGIYNSSHKSDEFYLAICGKKIIFAYNCNFFIMDEKPY